jgi:hypothetical protein
VGGEVTEIRYRAQSAKQIIVVAGANEALRALLQLLLLYAVYNLYSESPLE